MDELAQAIGIEPLEFRLKNLKDTRLRAVFEAAAKAFGWGNKPPKEHGFGIRNNFPNGIRRTEFNFCGLSSSIMAGA